MGESAHEWFCMLSLCGHWCFNYYFWLERIPKSHRVLVQWMWTYFWGNNGFKLEFKNIKPFLRIT